MKRTLKKEMYEYRLEYYIGSLDFPCDFCDSNSYKNYHLRKGNTLIVVCEDCLKEVKERVENEFNKM